MRVAYDREGRRVEERGAVERLKRGDVGALETLVRAHQTRALRAAYLIVRDRALAEDVVQQAFLRAYEKIGRFDETRPFGPWFTKIVVNDAVKAASRRERTIPFGHKGGEDAVGRLVDPGTSPQGLAEEAEERRRVWAALEKLPPTQRATVVQRYYLGLSEAEMAGMGGSPLGTIKWRLHAARKSLHKLLRPEAKEAPVKTDQRERLERVLRGLAEQGVPDGTDLWPEIRERVSGESVSTGQRSGERTTTIPRRRVRLPQLVPDTPLGWALAVLSVLILGAACTLPPGRSASSCGTGPQDPASVGRRGESNPAPNYPA